MGFGIETLGIHFQDQKYSIENIQTIEIDGRRDIIDGHRRIIDPNHTPYTLIQNRASNYFMTGYDQK